MKNEFVQVIFIFLLSFTCCFASERNYLVGRDIGFRWRTSLNVSYNNRLVECEKEHDRLKEAVQSYPDSLKNSGKANVAAASLEIIFAGITDREVVDIPSKNYYHFYTSGMDKCFTTARIKGTERTYKPVTYDDDTLDESISYIFNAINVPIPSLQEGESYKDAEYQIVCELFKKSRFINILKASLEKLEKNIDSVKLIILHIHTQRDPCAICAEMLCKLSQTLNYDPEKLIKDDKPLCARLKSHQTQFLIEVSSDEPYRNAASAGVDTFYLRERLDKKATPLRVPNPSKFPSSFENVTKEKNPLEYFPPFVVFKNPQNLVIFNCLLDADMIASSSLLKKEEEEQKKGSSPSSSSGSGRTFASNFIPKTIGEIEELLRQGKIMRRDVPGDGECGYHALDPDPVRAQYDKIEDRGKGKQSRKYVAEKLLENVKDAGVRKLIAPEIEGFLQASTETVIKGIFGENFLNTWKEIQTVQQRAEESLQKALEECRQVVKTEIKPLNIKEEELTKERILSLAETQHPELKEMEKFQKMKNEIDNDEKRAWLAPLYSEDTVRTYLANVIQNGDMELVCSQKGGSTGVADAFAKVENRNLVIINENTSEVLRAMDNQATDTIVIFMSQGRGFDSVGHFKKGILEE